MKCIVCGKEYEAAKCPRCHFDYIQVSDQAPAEVLQSLKQMVENYRQQFFTEVRLQIPIYYWKDQNGNVVEDRMELLYLGNAAGLKETVWVEQKFARIPDEKELPITVRISAKGDSWEKTLSVPNLQQPELQQIGATVDKEGNLKLLLRNETGKPTESATVSLFE